MGELIYLPKPISFHTEMEKYCLLYKQLQASLATIWCGRLTSDKGRRLLLACNQTYLSLWHPSGTSLMKQVEKMFLRKTEREEIDPKRGRAPLLSPGCDLFGTLPRRQLCQWSGRLACFIYITDVFVQPGSLGYLVQVNLELEFKLVTAAKACGSGSTNRGLILCCHPAGLKAGQWRKANRGCRDLAEARRALKTKLDKSYLKCLDLYLFRTVEQGKAQNAHSNYDKWFNYKVTCFCPQACSAPLSEGCCPFFT